MRQKVSVVLYTRPGCHLCEDAKAQMLAAKCADLYDLHEINIELDPALVERYGTKIPVITINGKKAFDYRIDAPTFRKMVVSAQST